jgi:hypothetical protein
LIIGHIGLVGPIKIITKKTRLPPSRVFLIPFFYSGLSDCPIPNRHAAFVSFTAQTLYSGMPEMGSRAALVRRLAAAKA